MGDKMAEVRKKEKVEKYNVEKELAKSKKKDSQAKKTTKKEVKPSTTKKESSKKKSLWTRFMIFCHGVKSEFNKVFWPTKENMVKYSITTILFVIFLAVFFYLIDVIFALFLKLFG
jgi:preprotein translocase subunit SecE